MSDPASDADNDGLTLLQECGTTKTDPTKADTDGDTLPDGWSDKNNNGKWDPGEGEDRNNNGKRDSGETDPRLADTDGGGERDDSEELKTRHDPLDPEDDNATGLFIYGGGGCSLARNGVDARRLEAKGFGETRPVADNRAREGRARNRRVEFIIIDPPQTK